MPGLRSPMCRLVQLISPAFLGLPAALDLGEDEEQLQEQQQDQHQRADGEKPEEDRKGA